MYTTSSEPAFAKGLEYGIVPVTFKNSSVKDAFRDSLPACDVAIKAAFIETEDAALKIDEFTGSKKCDGDIKKVADILVPASKATGIEMGMISPAEVSFKFKGASKTPINVRISYAERWKAYESGREIQVMKDVTNQIVLVPEGTEGQIILRYEKNAADFAGYAATLLTILVLIVFYAQSKKKGPDQKKEA